VVRDRGVEMLQEITLGAHADDSVDDLAVAENIQRGNRAYIVLGSEFRIRVDVDFGDDSAPFTLRGDFVERRCHHAAGTAPGCPEIDDHGLLVRGVYDVVLKTVSGDSGKMRESIHSEMENGFVERRANVALASDSVMSGVFELLHLQ